VTFLGALGPLPYDYGRGVTADGSLVVGQALRDASGGFMQHAYRWTAGTGMVQFDSVTQLEGSDARAITPDGSVIVGYNGALPGSKAYRWTQANGFVSLDPSGSHDMSPRAVSGDRSVIGGALGDVAFLWDEQGGIRPLDQALTARGVDITGWTFNEIKGVSLDGTVLIGNGTHDGHTAGFYVTLVPEPSGALVGVGLTAVACVTRVRRRS